MCGITGILQMPHASRSADLAATGQMTARPRHRGPDANRYWSDRNVGLALGRHRLAIIDLIDAGRQPMSSASARTLRAVLMLQAWLDSTGGFDASRTANILEPAQ